MTKDPTSELANEPATEVVEDFRTVERPPAEHAFFGHPRGLATLFFTEFWERFSYYGMRALLVLFMTAAVVEGGLGFDAAKAGAIYGLYTAGVYLLALPGGWLADRLFGQQRAIFIGGCIIASGHFTMAIPHISAFYLGLVLILLGTGLLKPNISAVVGELYPEGGARRDAGFSIFYMGINLGAFVAPFVCGYLGEEVNWHLGFAMAGIGMVAGLIQYAVGRKYLGEAGKLQPSGLAADERAREKRRIYLILGCGFLAAGLFAALMSLGVLPFSVIQVAQYASIFILSAGALFFIYMFVAGRLDATEKKRVGVVALLFLFSALFWAGFEQAGSSFNIFARDMTDRLIGGWEMPASWFQSANPLFIIALAPVFGALWVWLGRYNPSIPVKFSLGLAQLGLGFLVMVLGAQAAASGELVSPLWLILAYLLHTTGELCLSPVGLSTVTKLAPKRFSSQMMGVWFISLSLGNLLAGLIAGQVETLPMSELFFWVFVLTAGGGLVLLIFSRPINKLAGGIK
jgi:POT family proton-dependent oligopeptide transporter